MCEDKILANTNLLSRSFKGLSLRNPSYGSSWNVLAGDHHGTIHLAGSPPGDVHARRAGLRCSLCCAAAALSPLPAAEPAGRRYSQVSRAGGGQRLVIVTSVLRQQPDLL